MAIPPDGVLDRHFDADHQRALLTLGGDPDVVSRDCSLIARHAIGALALPGHQGVHPRFGVVDVLPVIPYRSEEAVAQKVARDLHDYISGELGVPVFTYERADPDGRSLPDLRRYLRTTRHETHPTAGVVCLGIRDPLIAFNLTFRGPIAAARAVARKVRAPEVRALGFELASRGLVQVSMNLIAPDRVGPKAAFDRVLALAGDDLELVECEVVGLVPESNLAELDGLPLRAPARSIEQALAESAVS